MSNNLTAETVKKLLLEGNISKTFVIEFIDSTTKQNKELLMKNSELEYEKGKEYNKGYQDCLAKHEPERNELLDKVEKLVKGIENIRGELIAVEYPKRSYILEHLIPELLNEDKAKTKKFKIVMIQSEKESNITLGSSICKNKLGLVIKDNNPSENYNCYVDNLEKGMSKYPQNTKWLNFQHLYIISDDEIKEGDWCIDLIRKSEQPKQVSKDGVELANLHNKAIKKIVATTDENLGCTRKHTDYAVLQLPQIPESYVKWYIEKANDSGVPVDFVELEMNGSYSSPIGVIGKDRIWVSWIKTNIDNMVIIKY